jgi:23S rRNA (cytidine1920-2'-O)/16S rRNA (cytidine1409-2'-O)-methyltransferase
VAEKVRLDRLLVDRGFYNTRARARDAILRKAVVVDGGQASKPGQLVNPAAHITLHDDAQDYVSRAALKLKHGLAHFAIPVDGKRVLDIGASTGGFVQVLLEAGATHIDAIDVGHGQLAPAIAEDARVTSIEGLNARDLTASHLSGPVEVITTDVSFISLKLALPPALRLAEPGALLVALIKPQFEVGRADVSSGGIVRDPARQQAVCEDIAAWLAQDQGWQVLGTVPSPIEGSDGNREFIMAARKT